MGDKYKYFGETVHAFTYGSTYEYVFDVFKGDDDIPVRVSSPEQMPDIWQKIVPHKHADKIPPQAREGEACCIYGRFAKLL